MPDKPLFHILPFDVEGAQLLAIPTRKDNYVYLLHLPDGTTVAVDPSDAEPVLDTLDANGWTLDYILSTHHHADHVGGNAKLVRRTGAVVAGYVHDRDRIPGIGIPINDGEHITLGGHQAEVLFIPGHTVGHIAYHFKSLKLLFTGDTLFSFGCGRLFEGTAEQMLASLKKLAALPEATRFCCGHEYTESNLRFARNVEPGNQDLARFEAEVKTLRAAGRPSLPGVLSEQLAGNPFLRCHLPPFRQYGATELEAFTAIRKLKDAF